MKSLLAAALLAASLPAPLRAAPSASSPRPPSLSVQEKEAKAGLRAKEKAAVDAVRAEAALPEARKKAEIKRIHLDYRRERRALEAGFSARRATRRAARRAK